MSGLASVSFHIRPEDELRASAEVLTTGCALVTLRVGNSDICLFAGHTSEAALRLARVLEEAAAELGEAAFAMHEVEIEQARAMAADPGLGS